MAERPFGLISLVRRSAPACNAGYSLKNVREALQAGELLDKKITSLGGKAKDSVPMFKKNNFVNLMDCKEWRDKFKGGQSSKIPLGAVMVYGGGRNGDARIKTPEGCSRGEGQYKLCTAGPGRKLLGVMVQISN